MGSHPPPPILVNHGWSTQSIPCWMFPYWNSIWVFFLLQNLKNDLSTCSVVAESTNSDVSANRWYLRNYRWTCPAGTLSLLGSNMVVGSSSIISVSTTQAFTRDRELFQILRNSNKSAMLSGSQYSQDIHHHFLHSGLECYWLSLVWSEYLKVVLVVK